VTWVVGPYGFGAAAAVGALVLVVAWWRGAPPATGPGAVLTDAGRLTGLLAGYVAVLQLLLRARLATVERGLGTDRINAAHRLLGAYLVLLVAAHGALIASGYSRQLHTSPGSQLAALVTDYSYVAWAMAAAGLLIVVGVTSTPLVRRRLRHEIWHCLHLLGYGALVLAFAHQVAVGEHFMQNRALRAAWAAVWIAVASTILWSRWLRPMQLAARHRLRISAIRRETSGAVSIELTGRRVDRLPGEAGQYFRWRFLDRRCWFVARPYSLSVDPDGHRLRITATTDGRYSALLPRLAVGTRVIPEGPCGGLIAPRRWDGPVLLVAGGIGITPLRALLPRCAGSPLVLVYRVHKAAEITFRNELDELARRNGARVHYLVGSRHEPRNALTADHLAELCPGLRRARVYVCGSASFVRHLRGALHALAVPSRNVRSESFEPW
jgi:ferredoxin-NADP reductase/DMSO/TMAO reductase YedYZ heme-binding membrane subunit